MSDPFDLARFVTAQDKVIEQVRDELRAGQKRTHWMWFVFPQLAGLGHSATARHYAIGSRQEAVAYLGHPILGSRLIGCGALVNAVENRSANAIFGSPDDRKFHSCMTLFAAVTDSVPVFDAALVRYFGGEKDPRTLALLARV